MAALGRLDEMLVALSDSTWMLLHATPSSWLLAAGLVLASVVLALILRTALSASDRAFVPARAPRRDKDVETAGRSIARGIAPRIRGARAPNGGAARPVALP